MTKRLDPCSIERAKSADLVSLVSQRVKLTHKGRAMWGLCPFHQEKTPSFKIEQGRFICFGCGARGDAIEWVKFTAGVAFRDAVVALSGDELPKAPHIVIRNERPTRCVTATKVREARAIWSSAKAIAGTHAESYLRARGIEKPENPSLRFIPAYSFAPGVVLPAMVAAVATPSRKISAVQVTFLDPNAPRKANVATPRRSIGKLASGAVRLASPKDGTLGLAEGLESALSAMAMTGVSAWCCLGAQRMHQVAIHSDIRELHIFADDDEAGRAAAERTAKANAGRRVVIRLPPTGFTDWNDVLAARKAAA